MIKGVKLKQACKNSHLQFQNPFQFFFACIFLSKDGVGVSALIC